MTTSAAQLPNERSLGTSPADDKRFAQEVQDGWIADGYAMGPRTLRALHGLIRGLCPADPELEGLEDRVEVGVRRMLRYMDPRVAFGMTAAMHLVDWSPLWRLKGRRPIHQMTASEADDAICDLSTSRLTLITTALLGLRAVITSQWYDDPAVHVVLDYKPRLFLADRVRARLRVLAKKATSRDALGRHSATTAGVPA